MEDLNTQLAEEGARDWEDDTTLDATEIARLHLDGEERPDIQVDVTDGERPIGTTMQMTTDEAQWDDEQDAEGEPDWELEGTEAREGSEESGHEAASSRTSDVAMASSRLGSPIVIDGLDDLDLWDNGQVSGAGPSGASSRFGYEAPSEIQVPSSLSGAIIELSDDD